MLSSSGSFPEVYSPFKESWTLYESELVAGQCPFCVVRGTCLRSEPFSGTTGADFWNNRFFQRAGPVGETNGTVNGVSGGSSRTLTIKYKDGEQVIEVAPDTPIVTRVLGDRSLLRPGAAVLVLAAQKDGGLVATGVTAEKDGVKPR